MQAETMLDLDDPGSLCRALHALLDAPGVWDTLLADVTGECDIFHELTHADEYVTTPLVRTLRSNVERVTRSEYTSVAAYHACRPADRATYTARGLVRTDEALLRNLTHDAFGETPEIEAAFVPACEEYLKWYDGTIGLFWTAHEKTDWHKCPCFLGKMADAMGETGRTLLTDFLARSIPTIIKCRLPLDWVDSKMRESATRRCASATLQRMILFRAMPQDATNDLGALGLKTDVPPEMIVGFLDPPNKP